MLNKLKQALEEKLRWRVKKIIYGLPEFGYLVNEVVHSTISAKAKLYSRYKIYDSSVGDYTYIAQNSSVSNTVIGKFCSIGPNFLCGWGIHPTTGVSTSPIFYSTLKQNGITLSKSDKTEERKQITIGNDVFIGMNVTVLDGVRIGNGAVIGAGAVVSKDIPPYAIAVGSPVKILRYRFDEDTIFRLQKTEWWNWPIDKLNKVEKKFFDVTGFLDENIDR